MVDPGHESRVSLSLRRPLHGVGSGSGSTGSGLDRASGFDRKGVGQTTDVHVKSLWERAWTREGPPLKGGLRGVRKQTGSHKYSG